MTLLRFFAVVVFFISMTITGFVAGSLIGALAVSKGSGLAGGASVLMFGIGGVVTALLLAVILLRKLSHAHFVRAVGVAGVLAILTGSWMLYRYINVLDEDHRDRIPPVEKPLRDMTEDI